MKHTPGPWKAVKDQDCDGYPRVFVRADNAEQESRAIICECYGPIWEQTLWQPEKAESNARLIAAAPRMLELLQEIILDDNYEATRTLHSMLIDVRNLLQEIAGEKGE